MPGDVWINKGSGAFAAGEIGVGSVIKVRVSAAIVSSSATSPVITANLNGSVSGAVALFTIAPVAPSAPSFIYIEFNLTPVSNTDLVVSGKVDFVPLSDATKSVISFIPAAADSSTITGFDFAGEAWTLELFLSWGVDDGSVMSPIQLTVTLNDIII